MFQSSAAAFEGAIIAEAHGLISDMLADSTLPLHVVSGLHAVSNLLKPVDSHNAVHKTKVSPLISLTEVTSYGSDTEDSPYTGERPSSLPKVWSASFGLLYVAIPCEMLHFLAIVNKTKVTELCYTFKTSHYLNGVLCQVEPKL